MPPAVTPVQSSRTGLLTALVVAILIAVAMTVTTFYAFEEWGKAEKDRNDLQARMKPIVAEAEFGDPRVQALIAASKDLDVPNALDASMAQGEQFTKLVGADAKLGRDSITKAAAEIDAWNTKKLVNFKLGADSSLKDAVDLLTNQLGQLANQKQELANQLAAAEQKTQQTLQAQKDLLDQKDKLIQEANAKAEEQSKQASQYHEQAQEATKALEGSATEQQRKLQTDNAELTKQLQANAKQIGDLLKQVGQFKAKLRQVRVSPGEAEVQHPSGSVIRLTDNNTLFISVGRNQSVTPGLTFEVYDRSKGVPPLGEGLSDSNLPVGKASIEVFNVGADTSECRVTRLSPGEQIAIGDLLKNLIYDPNTKYNFVVYGDFDLTHSGVASPGDAEIVKRLITQWGGRVQKDIDVDTDFVVMGKEPLLPPISDPNDPIEVERNRLTKEKIDKYLAEETKAGQLTIPIMNQNRFLYFIGYYDLAQR